MIYRECKQRFHNYNQQIYNQTRKKFSYSRTKQNPRSEFSHKSRLPRIKPNRIDDEKKNNNENPIPEKENQRDPHRDSASKSGQKKEIKLYESKKGRKVSLIWH